MIIERAYSASPPRPCVCFRQGCVMLLDSRFLISPKAPDRAAADSQSAGDFRFAEASGEKVTSFSGLVCDRWWAAQALTLVASMKQAGADSFA